jgi:pSer/pThr/pTyr-binding forkhead associated (FHA) protein
MSLSKVRQLEIVVTEGARHYARCLLVPGVYRLGQERWNEVTIDEPSVSARHARLTFSEDGTVFIEDAESANGTFVDDEFADRPLVIGPGARVRLGACMVELRTLPGGE